MKNIFKNIYFRELSQIISVIDGQPWLYENDVNTLIPNTP